MWRRIYLFLVLVRLYLALSPSYLHPDENFQGPEVIAGRIFRYPVHRTWEFTSSRPVRSVYPLWPVYGLPMLLLRWVWGGGEHHDQVAPETVYWVLRLLMFILSFVLQDWAIHELIQSPRRRRLAIMLVASSYVTWTYQTHTFSNSIETLLVAWCLVLIRKVLDDDKRSSMFSSGLLAFLMVFGIFNRVTFPAYVLLPGLQLIPYFLSRPLSLLSAAVFGGLSVLLGLCLDTAYYNTGPWSVADLVRRPVITPLNNLIYNLDPENLVQHGLHPYHHHVLGNLPLLLGAAFPLVFWRPRFGICLASAASGVLFLSLIRHQEARFLTPAVPLFLSSIQLPKRYLRSWMALWIGINVFMGLLMGVFHQGGVVPTQNFLARQHNVSEVLWWRTYNPPTWLLDGRNEHMKTTVLMGMQPESMFQAVVQATPCMRSGVGNTTDTFLVAPDSSTFLDRFTQPHEGDPLLRLRKVWQHRRHLNLDDLDVGSEGVWGTLKRVIGRRGLTTWKVDRPCP